MTAVNISFYLNQSHLLKRYLPWYLNDTRSCLGTTLINFFDPLHMLTSVVWHNQNTPHVVQ